MPRQLIVAAGFHGFNALDLFGTLQAFAAAAEVLRCPGPPPYRMSDLGIPTYRLRICTADGAPCTTMLGLPVGGDCAAADLLSGSDGPIDTLIVPGGFGIADLMHVPARIAWLGDLARSARRVCGVGGGAYLLGALGLLDDRRCTTSWHLVDRVQHFNPRAVVQGDSIFVQDGNIWSGAGGAASLDLGLALVEADHGRAMALRVARRLILPFLRRGGDPQFSALLATQSLEDKAFDELHAWVVRNLRSDLRVELLAERMNMSLRNFTRRYKQIVGMSARRAVEAMRLEAARRALEEGDFSIASIADRYGLGGEDRLRRAFIRRYGISPGAYRASQRSSDAAPAASVALDPPVAPRATAKDPGQAVAGQARTRRRTQTCPVT